MMISQSRQVSGTPFGSHLKHSRVVKPSILPRQAVRTHSSRLAVPSPTTRDLYIPETEFASGGNFPPSPKLTARGAMDDFIFEGTLHKAVARAPQGDGTTAPCCDLSLKDSLRKDMFPEAYNCNFNIHMGNVDQVVQKMRSLAALPPAHPSGTSPAATMGFLLLSEKLIDMCSLDIINAGPIITLMEAIAALRFGSDVSPLTVQHFQSLGASIRLALDRACYNYPDSVRTEDVIRVIEASAAASPLLAFGPEQTTYWFNKLRRERLSMWGEGATISQSARIIKAEGNLQLRYNTSPGIFIPSLYEAQEHFNAVARFSDELSFNELEGVAGAVAGYGRIIEPTRSLRVLSSVCHTAVDRLAEAPPEKKKETVTAAAAVIATAEHTASGLRLAGAATELMVEVGGWLRRAFSRGT